ncbi:MAG: hypothetical protein NDI84_16275, partial [Steroidobacteraceae bacterium]|nr:hypothetical protein [Steroidobacteraceae bacterium]
MVTSHSDLALLALRVYATPTSMNGSNLEFNRPGVPAGWTELEWHPDAASGFSYGVYRNGSDVVVAYAGTNQLVDWSANLTNAIGLSSGQTTRAALAYLQAKAEYGENVTFTGHSLGGGIASTMAVWFKRPAVVFDQAPFEVTARNLLAVAYTKAALSLAGYSDPNFRPIEVVSDFYAREAAVTSYAVQGEILETLRARWPYVAGAERTLSFGTDGMQGRGIDLHSQALLAGGLMNDSFRTATKSVQTALPLLMNERLYAFSTTSSDENLLVDLIRSEQASPSNGKLTHFAADLNKLGTNLAGLNAAAQNAIIAQAIEWYYWQGADYAGQEFFTPANGALQYATAQGDALPGALNKAGPYTRLWLNPSSNFRTTAVPAFAQWNIATASTGSVAVARDPNKSQVFVGGAGADRFTGGAASDVMLGGAGNDTYIVSGGRDRVQDDLGGQGALVTASGQALSGGRGSGSRAQWVGTSGEIYQFTPTQSADLGTLTISNLGAGNEVKIDKFDYAQATGSTGYLGIKLDNTTKVALTEGAGTRYWNVPGADIVSLAGRSSTVLESCGKGFTVNLSNAAKAGDKLQFNLQGLSGKQLKVVNGASTVDAEGAVIDLVEGQTSVSFALVQDGGLDADAAGALSVTYQSPDGNATSNEWGLTLQDSGATTSTFIGDQRPRISGSTYLWAETQWAANGTLINGVYEADFADVLYA